MAKPVIDRELLLSVAKNARLNLSEAEVKKFLPKLKNVLEYFSMLDYLDVSGEKPAFQPVETKNRMREDVAGKSISQGQALSNTKNKKDGYFKGPGIL